MDKRQEHLERLKELQILQNAQMLEGRVRDLEEQVSALQSSVQELTRNLSLLQMEFNKDHIKLGAQDATYRAK